MKINLPTSKTALAGLVLAIGFSTMGTQCPLHLGPAPTVYPIFVTAPNPFPTEICSLTATLCPPGTPLGDLTVTVSVPSAPTGTTVTFSISAGADGMVTSVIRAIPGTPVILGGLTQTLTIGGGGAAQITIGASVDGDDDVITATVNIAGGGSVSNNYATIVS